MIIGISGHPGTGKDSLADAIKSFYGNFEIISFSSQIRKFTQLIYGLDDYELELHPYKDMKMKEFNYATPRELTIKTGRFIEEEFTTKIWETMIEREIVEPFNYIVPSLRTVRNAQWVKEHEGLLIRINDIENPICKYEIENKLNDYKDWDLVINKQEWFEDPKSVLKKVQKLLENDVQPKLWFKNILK